jgi:hypothetical protein
LIAALARGKRKLPRRAKSLLVLLLLLGGIWILTACGGGSGGSFSPASNETPKGTYTVQVVVTGTGGLSQSTNISLIVQ